MTDKLLPCPFCEESITFSSADPSGHGRAAYHFHPDNDCWLAGSMIGGEWVPAPRWNRRAPPSPDQIAAARREERERCARVAEMALREGVVVGKRVKPQITPADLADRILADPPQAAEDGK